MWKEFFLYFFSFSSPQHKQIFQCGWATVQIAHLSILPELTSNEKERSELNGIRYGFSLISNITVFVIAYIFINNDEVSMLHVEIGPKDYSKFKVNVVEFLSLQPDPEKEIKLLKKFMNEKNSSSL